ncbi:hypothetical protein [Micromonospora globbae]|uniref:hypothetical protein n=1 Tax=Micromonospora globbae TaxID=1894969 RepID=UPI003423ACA4
MGGHTNGGRYAAAALLAGAAALALVALGWWARDWEYRADRGRFLDPEWWAGTAVSALGHLALGTVGFKIALGAVGLAVAAGVGLRRRRSSRLDDQLPGARPDGPVGGPED